MKENVKAARIVIDLAEDEALSRVNDSKDIKGIISNIIN